MNVCDAVTMKSDNQEERTKSGGGSVAGLTLNFGFLATLDANVLIFVRVAEEDEYEEDEDSRG